MRAPRAEAWVAVAIGSVLAACVTVWPSYELLPNHRTAAIPDSELVGGDECTICHEDVSGFAPAPAYHADCEACHGPGSLHSDSKEPTEIRFPPTSDCLNCHGTGRSSQLAWTGSEHARTGVLCSDCHAIHEREPQHLREADGIGDLAARHGSGTTKLCLSCHGEVAARLDLPSHHPIREGMLDCTDCHTPHESRRVALGSRTSLCSDCHQDVVGPWIYEHAPVAEDCAYCHTPHGAASTDLLTINQPGACISCHSLAEMGATHEPQAFVSRCTDCHSAIHGSYADPHLRR